MASDNHAHYSKIGFAVLLAAAAIVTTLVWLGGLGEGEDPVAAIDFVCNHYEVIGKENSRIYIKMALDRRLFLAGEDEGYTAESLMEKLVSMGLRATVTASGITGLSRIECDLFPDAPPPPQISWTPRVPYIPPKMSLLEDFSSAATRVMNQINTMDFAGVWSNITATTEHLSESVRSVRTLLDENRGEIGRILDSTSEAVDSIKELSADLRRNPSALIRERRVEPLEETR